MKKILILSLLMLSCAMQSNAAVSYGSVGSKIQEISNLRDDIKYEIDKTWNDCQQYSLSSCNGIEIKELVDDIDAHCTQWLWNPLDSNQKARIYNNNSSYIELMTKIDFAELKKAYHRFKLPYYENDVATIVIAYKQQLRFLLALCQKQLAFFTQKEEAKRNKRIADIDHAFHLLKNSCSLLLQVSFFADFFKEIDIFGIYDQINSECSHENQDLN